MRFAGFLCIVLIALFVVQFKIYGGKSEEAYNAAAAAMTAKGPIAAYDAFKPAFKYGNLETLGKADRMRNKFLDMIVRETVDPMRKGNPDLVWVGRLEDALDVLKRAADEQKLDVKSRQKEILKAVAEARPQLQESMDLPAWDRMSVLIAKLPERGFAPDDFRPALDAMVAEYGKVDRRGIGLRDAIARATAHLKSGVELLGVQTPAGGPADPLLSALPEKIKSKNMIDADKAFNDGLAVCLQFGATFHEPDLTPELRLARAKLTYNLAAMRLHHLMTQGPKMLSDPSDYVVSLFVRPNTTEVPSEGEIYGAYINQLNEGIGASARMFESGHPGLGRAQTAALEAAAHQLQNMCARSVGRGAQGGAGYPSAKQAALGDAVGRNAVETIEKSSLPCVAVR